MLPCAAMLAICDATVMISRACIAAAVPSLSTWYVLESSGGGMASPPAARRFVMSLTSHVCTTYARSPGGTGVSSSTCRAAGGTGGGRGAAASSVDAQGRARAIESAKGA